MEAEDLKEVFKLETWWLVRCNEKISFINDNDGDLT